MEFLKKEKHKHDVNECAAAAAAALYRPKRLRRVSPSVEDPLKEWLTNHQHHTDLLKERSELQLQIEKLQRKAQSSNIDGTAIFRKRLEDHKAIADALLNVCEYEERLMDMLFVNGGDSLMVPSGQKVEYCVMIERLAQLVMNAKEDKHTLLHASTSLPDDDCLRHFTELLSKLTTRLAVLKKSK